MFDVIREKFEQNPMFWSAVALLVVMVSFIGSYHAANADVRAAAEAAQAEAFAAWKAETGITAWSCPKGVNPVGFPREAVEKICIIK